MIYTICELPKNVSSWDLSDEDINKYIIFSTKEEINFYNKLKINGSLYYIGHSRHLKDKEVIYFFVRKFNFNKEEDLKIESEITCPYCGDYISNSCEMDNSGDNIACECCGSTFSYQREVTVEYWTRPVKKNTNFKEL
jgi:formylmethanofuran dehydrogenase subunit E